MFAGWIGDQAHEMAVLTRRQRELLAWLARSGEPSIFVLGQSFNMGTLMRHDETHPVIREDLHELVDQHLVRRTENRYEVTDVGRFVIRRELHLE